MSTHSLGSSSRPPALTRDGLTQTASAAELGCLASSPTKQQTAEKIANKIKAVVRLELGSDCPTFTSPVGNHLKKIGSIASEHTPPSTPSIQPSPTKTPEGKKEQVQTVYECIVSVLELEKGTQAPIPPEILSRSRNTARILFQPPKQP